MLGEDFQRQWEVAIKQYKQDPRGGAHWVTTNALFDKILKEKLQDAPLLKYHAPTLMALLHRVYIFLRTHYWENLCEEMLGSPENNLWRSFSKHMPFKIPLYIRLITLFIRIILDRMSDPRFDKLPGIPANYYFQTQYLAPGSFGSETGRVFTFIDHLSGNASRIICDFFEEAIGPEASRIQKLSPHVLLPIPFIAYYQYITKGRDINKIFAGLLPKEEQVVERKMPTINGETIILNEVTPNFILASRDPKFSQNFLCDLVILLRDIYIGLASPRQQDLAKKMCDLMCFFLKEYAPVTLDVQATFYETLDVQLFQNHLDSELLKTYTYDGEHLELSLADPSSAPELFRHSLTLFDKPFMKDSTGTVYFSPFWLFDAFVNRITDWLRRASGEGMIRGLRTESYLAFKAVKDLTEKLPNIKISQPFKIVLFNQDRAPKSRKFADIRDKFQKFKYPVIEIPVTSTEIGKKGFTYIEFDFAFTFLNALVVVEVKDDLYWDLRDLPYSIYLWQEAAKQKLREKVAILEKVPIRSKMELVNIYFDKIISRLITQDHLFSIKDNIKDHCNYIDLVEALMNYEADEREGKHEERLFWHLRSEWPPYPWKE